MSIMVLMEKRKFNLNHKLFVATSISLAYAMYQAYDTSGLIKIINYIL